MRQKINRFANSMEVLREPYLTVLSHSHSPVYINTRKIVFFHPNELSVSNDAKSFDIIYKFAFRFL